jgi:hypothetical protein
MASRVSRVFGRRYEWPKLLASTERSWLIGGGRKCVEVTSCRGFECVSNGRARPWGLRRELCLEEAPCVTQPAHAGLFLSPERTTSVTLESASHDGRLLAYGLRRGSQDETEILDVEGRRELPNRLSRALSWPFRDRGTGGPSTSDMMTGCEGIEPQPTDSVRVVARGRRWRFFVPVYFKIY